MQKHLMRYAFFISCLGWAPYAVAEDWSGEAGKADTVKDWSSRDFENSKNSGLPLCLYFFDPDMSPNYRARLLEGKSALASAEVKAKLRGFLCLKIRSDATDVKGWPAQLRTPAHKSASLVFMSADLQQIISFEKTMPNEQINPESVLAAAQRILNYEEQLKTIKSPGKTDKPKTPAPPLDTKVPGLKTGDEEKPLKTPEKKKKKPAPADE